jgi:hypothetical protein
VPRDVPGPSNIKTGFFGKAAMLAGVFRFFLPAHRSMFPARAMSAFPRRPWRTSGLKPINEKPDSVLYLPLGSDVLVPEAEGRRLAA